MILLLPLPPSRNRVESFRNGLHSHTAKRRYQRKAWAAAVGQERSRRDPPARVRVSAHFRLYGPLRDEDGLDLKWVLDTLRQHQTGKLRWRQGLYDECGYFVDVSPEHLELGSVTQEIDRLNRGLVLTLEPVV